MMPRLRAILSATSLLFTCACTALLNASVPSSGYRVVSDVAYGDDPRQTLDIYIPDGITTPRDVLVFYYGGSWKMGDKSDYKFVGEAFASKGYVTVIADYRLYPQIYYPEFMHDTARAFVWVHDHIAKHGGDVNNIFVSGHSAGAYNAVMLSVHPEFLKAAGGKREWIRGTLGIAGPYDFLPFTDADVIGVFSRVKDADTQPINFITGRYAPMFLATGNDDDVVGVKNSVNVTKKLEANGSPVELKRYDGADHVDIILSTARGFRGITPLREDMVDFMNRHRAPSSATLPK